MHGIDPAALRTGAQAMRLCDDEDDSDMRVWLDRHMECVDRRIVELAPDAESLAA